MTPGEPTTIQFDVHNGRDRKIVVEIDLDGDVDFKNQSRPLTGSVLAHVILLNLFNFFIYFAEIDLFFFFFFLLWIK